jgi:hypothetical protein
MILNAQAQASIYVQSAISGHHARLTKAHNEMAEFNGLYEQFARNPQLIIAGNFRGRIGSIIAQSGGSIIVPDGSEAPVILLP